jgi:hypothetical protein
MKGRVWLEIVGGGIRSVDRWGVMAVEWEKDLSFVTGIGC